jgi:hypothetical protein
MFFRHHTEDRWIRGDQAAFALVEKTPMGFGFAAVDASVRGSVDLDEARRKCLDRAGRHGGQR